MRLINTKTLQLEEFFDTSRPKYAILSHTWETEEVLFADMADLDKARAKAGFAKVQGACALAARQGYDYIWIDTCCIDKTSSAELSEAINSMFNWYQRSGVCYAYICDVQNSTEIAGSRWFTRGWTLQELVAPYDVVFYSATWEYMGKKRDTGFISLISAASKVEEPVLSHAFNYSEVSVARKMYWASHRTTTRLEDQAYCLMGLFQVNMPLLYGEGEAAFMRLQQEIIKVSNDLSILAWYGHPELVTYVKPSTWLQLCRSIFAPSAAYFAMSGDISLQTHQSLPGFFPKFNPMAGGVTEFSAIMLTDPESRDEDKDKPRTVVLPCQIGPIPGTFPTLVLEREWGATSSYRRTLEQSVVSQVSLHDSDFLLAHKEDQGPVKRNYLPIEVKPGKLVSRSLGMDSDLLITDQPGPAQYFRGSGKADISTCLGYGEANVATCSNLDRTLSRKLEIERITVGATWLAHTPGIPKPPPSVVDEMEEGKPAGGYERKYGRHFCFWVLPLNGVKSPATISLLDASPRGCWDGASRQLHWSKYGFTDSPGREKGKATAGVAKLDVAQTIQGEKTGAESLGNLVVTFGIEPKPVPPGEEECSEFRYWCTLVKHDGALDLEQYLKSQVPPETPQSLCSLALDSALTLNASVSEAIVTGELYIFLKLWITSPDTDQPAKGKEAQPTAQRQKSLKDKLLGRYRSGVRAIRGICST